MLSWTARPGCCRQKEQHTVDCSQLIYNVLSMASMWRVPRSSTGHCGVGQRNNTCLSQRGILIDQINCAARQLCRWHPLSGGRHPACTQLRWQLPSTGVSTATAPAARQGWGQRVITPARHYVTHTAVPSPGGLRSRLLRAAYYTCMHPATATSTHHSAAAAAALHMPYNALRHAHDTASLHLGCRRA